MDGIDEMSYESDMERISVRDARGEGRHESDGRPTSVMVGQRERREMGSP